MVRGIVYVMELLLVFILQSSVFSYLDVAGVVPDCIVILVIAVGYMRGRIPALIIGFFAGLLVDLSFSSLVGTTAVIYMTIGFLAGFVHKFFDERDYIIPLAMIPAGSFLFSFIYYLFQFLLRSRLRLPYYLLHIILPKMIYTLIAAILLYPLLLLINHLLLKLEGKEL